MGGFSHVIGKKEIPREGKTVFTGSVTGFHPKAKKKDQLPAVDQVFRVTIRTTDSKGDPFLFPDIEIEVYWTNLYEDPQKVIALYNDHGTGEQFHSELKTDMNVERLPSGKMAVNALILHLAMIAFNTLRFIGQTALQYREYLPYHHKGKRKRLRKVIDDLIRVACRLVSHANKLILKVWEHDPWLPVMKKIYAAL